MKIKTNFLVLLILMLVALGDAIAASRHRIARVGILMPGHSSPYLAAFRRALKKLGYIEGENILIEHPYWHYQETRNRLPELAAELVRRKVSVIVPHDPAAVEAAMNATKTVPIVMPDGGADAVSAGFVKSLSRPGGNVTGLSTGANGLGSKRIELLKEAFPSVNRVAVLNPQQRPMHLEEYRHAARMLGLKLKVVNVRRDEDLAPAFTHLAKMDSAALIIGHAFVTHRNAIQIGGFLLKNRVPSISSHRYYVRFGAVMSYGVNYLASWRRAAVYVDKILKGANPASLPVEPPQLELVVNLKTAEKIGVTIPPEILLEANEVIK